MPDDHAPDDALPSGLIDAMKRADRPPPVITAGVDRAMADLASSHFRGRRATWKRNGGWAALAASVALVALVVFQPGDPLRDEAMLYTDVDGSGGIDIADVFALARAGSPGVEQADLDAFAMRVVSLDGGA